MDMEQLKWLLTYSDDVAVTLRPDVAELLGLETQTTVEDIRIILEMPVETESVEMIDDNDELTNL